ncbi:MAG: hypothetical protein AVDCRST_MAG36-109 [uncultured Nocardioidaceae bacterium]|uniref:STAS domain-containing protein n=1 Tax=uncultured Nocardioidaceae bacterium TaxID=253824 RepID=A0A6J4KUP4_9ACTN|nr:MAG: hypothetical protein AVDCRST_MAG36-109 [uncultured Nocardioidaceae bacterium]
MTFDVDVDGSVLRVAVKGELDLACADLFDCLFDLSTDGIETVVLDLGALTFCDVTGVNALSGLRGHHLDAGRAVHVLDVLPQVRRVVALTDDLALLSRPDTATA